VKLPSPERMVARIGRPFYDSSLRSGAVGVCIHLYTHRAHSPHLFPVRVAYFMYPVSMH